MMIAYTKAFTAAHIKWAISTLNKCLNDNNTMNAQLSILAFHHDKKPHNFNTYRILQHAWNGTVKCVSWTFDWHLQK